MSSIVNIPQQGPSTEPTLAENTGFFGGVGRRVDLVLGAALEAVRKLAGEHIKGHIESPEPALVQFNDGVRSASFLYSKPGQALEVAHDPLNRSSNFVIAHPTHKSRSCQCLLITTENGQELSVRFDHEDTGVNWSIRDLGTGHKDSVEVPYNPDLSLKLEVGKSLKIGNMEFGTIKSMVAVGNGQTTDPSYGAHLAQIKISCAVNELK